MIVRIANTLSVDITSDYYYDTDEMSEAISNYAIFTKS